MLVSSIVGFNFGTTQVSKQNVQNSQNHSSSSQCQNQQSASNSLKVHQNKPHRQHSKNNKLSLFA